MNAVVEPLVSALRRSRGRPLKGAPRGEMRQALIDAAIACFAGRGYAATSNREIAERAGVTTSLLYHYFESKAALFRAALVEVNQRLLDIYRAAAVAAPDAPSMQQLALGLKSAVDLTHRQPELMRFAGQAEAEIARHPELALGETEGRDDFIGFFRAMLDRARVRGELAPGVAIEAGVRVLSAFMTRLAELGGEGQDPEQFAQNMGAFEHMLQGDFMRQPTGRRLGKPDAGNSGELIDRPINS